MAAGGSMRRLICGERRPRASARAPSASPGARPALAYPERDEREEDGEGGVGEALAESGVEERGDRARRRDDPVLGPRDLERATVQVGEDAHERARVARAREPRVGEQIVVRQT